jgi:hypothetical protein
MDSPSSGPTRGLQTIRVVTFEFCSAEKCPWGRTAGVHQLVSSHTFDLQQDGGAVAISYTWGEFERTRRVVGHNSTGEDVVLTLGAEWNTEDFANRLALLCLERGACWIDQLCFLQGEAEVRESLASITSIYKTLNVVVLMPGAPCRCLREYLEMWKVAMEFGSRNDRVSLASAHNEAALEMLEFDTLPVVVQSVVDVAGADVFEAHQRCLDGDERRTMCERGREVGYRALCDC